MANDVNTNIVVAAKGFDAVQKDVEALRNELQELGIDTATLEKRLTSIEKASNAGSRGLKEAARASRDSSTASKQNAAASKQEADALDETALAAKAAAAENSKLISSRYALYDVANAYGAVGTALVGVGIYAATVGASFESAFTNVARTLETDATVEEINAIRGSLVQLSGQIPLTFQEISQIATLGNQLGLTADKVVDFTGTVARFASVSGLSIDAVSSSFGGFLAQTGLSADYLENLGSSIALVSINSKATEAQIVSLVRELAAGASGAGFAADEIVGLAGALASFQVAPERARGVLDTYFGTLNRAVAEGGDRLELFARISGHTAEELDNLVRTGEGSTVFRELLAGIQELNPDAAQLTQILDGLGLSGLRASNTFQRFLGNLSIADDAFQDAYTGFIEGAELNRQYEQTLDDLSSQFTIFTNGLNALIEAISGGAVGSLAQLFAGINNIVFALTDFINQNREIATVIATLGAIGAILGVMLLFRAALTAATAATFAMRTALAGLGPQALASAGTLRGLTGALFGVRNGSVAAAGGLLTLRGALRSLLAASGIGLLVTLGGELLGGLFDNGSAAQDAALSLEQYDEATRKAQAGSDGAATGADALTDSLGGAGKEAETAAVKIRTLTDYVNDLTGVFNRSSDLRFGSDAALDEITLRWIKLNEEAEKFQQTIRSLTAERGLKQYFLEIAELYDDQIRAAQLREEIAKIDDDLAAANAGASTELQGNSKAAIENRKVFRDLLGSYEDYVAALSSAGASQEQIQAVISQLNKDFGTQATSLGFNSGEVLKYQTRFSDLARIVEQLPQDITVGYDPNPAQQALNEFFAKAAADAAAAGAGIGNALANGIGGGIGGLDYDELFGKETGRSQGRTVAKNWWEEFLNFLDDVFVKWPEQVGIWVGQAVDTVLAEGQKQGQALWDGFTGWLGTLFPGFGAFLSTFIDPKALKIENTGLLAGSGYGGGLISGLDSKLRERDPLGGWLNTQNNNAYGAGSTVGSNIGGGILAGLNGALSKSNGFGATYTGNGTATVGKLSLFAGGGYTGAGHWLKPAGVVHAGEYVIPKKHVDQSTGLPNMNYVASLQRGKSAPKMGYATGGHVSSGPSGPMDLSASTIAAISNALSVRLRVGSSEIASASSRGDRQLAYAGSN